ncbi:MAG TPA: methyltransferase [Clostridiales bacterium]|nr:methyltransferase [Clostridiales bacterium]
MQKIEPLGGKIKIYVSQNHTFGTDAVLLADFAAPKKADIALDLGTGCGIIPMLWMRSDAPKHVIGIDIQKEACGLAERSIELCGVEERFKVLNLDLRNPEGLPKGHFSLITCNPPYKSDGAGIQNYNISRRIARHETECSLEDIIKTSSMLLRSTGRLCLCHRPERLTDIMVLMRSYKIEPKRLRTVHQRQGCEPWLILIEGRRDSKPGLRIAPPLYIEHNGQLSEEMLEIYGDYKTGHI